ncbi:bis-aminopropyl spermidine synthase family protein [Flindersiella endophytica]
MLITPSSPVVAHRRSWQKGGLGAAEVFRLAQLRGAVTQDLPGQTRDSAGPPPVHPCPACSGLGFLTCQSEEWARETTALRASELTTIDQCHLDEPSLLRRLTILCASRPMSNTSVVFVGDDDLASVALLRHDPPERLLLLDVDERVLAVVRAEAHRLDLADRLVTHHVDLTVPGAVEEIIGEYGETFDVAVTDPPYAEGGMRTFVGLACRLLTHTGEVHVAVPAVLAEAWSDELLLAVQADLTACGFLIERLLPGAFTYTSSNVISSLVVARRLAGARYPDTPILVGEDRFYTTRTHTGAIANTITAQCTTRLEEKS